MYRGEIWWANLPDPVGSEPGYRRPVLIIQDDVFTQSLISTVIVVIITSNTQLAEVPGNVLLSQEVTGLSGDSVANVSQKFSQSIRHSWLNALVHCQTICMRR